MNTIAGKLKAHQVGTMRDIHLPECDKSCQISQQKILVFEHDDCKYDIIFGTNFLYKVGTKLNYDQGIKECYDATFPLCPHKDIDSKDFDGMEDMTKSSSKMTSWVRIG